MFSHHNSLRISCFQSIVLVTIALTILGEGQNSGFAVPTLIILAHGFPSK
jgi:hypothetical protein